jgi:hypothetical protein
LHSFYQQKLFCLSLYSHCVYILVVQQPLSLRRTLVRYSFTRRHTCTIEFNSAGNKKCKLKNGADELTQHYNLY